MSLKFCHSLTGMCIPNTSNIKDCNINHEYYNPHQLNTLLFVTIKKWGIQTAGFKFDQKIHTQDHWIRIIAKEMIQFHSFTTI